MKSKTNIGVMIITLSALMFFFGVSLFAFRGPPLNHIISFAGMFSFFACIPVFIIGVFVLIYARKHMNDEMKQ